MNASIEQRLTDHYAHRTAGLRTTGPGVPDSTAFLSDGGPGPGHGRARMILVGAAAAATVLGLVAVGSMRSDSDESRPVAGQPDIPLGSTPTQSNEPLAPASQLPDSGDLSEAPVTVDAVDSPTVWFRLAPDLDIAWYQSGNGADASTVCWRTPVETYCIPDDNSIFGEPIPTGGDQTLVLVLGPEDTRTNYEIGLSDFTVLSAPIEWSDVIGWGVARFAVPDGLTIVQPAVSGATLPPANDLVDVPVTIVREDGVFSYWRWLPDVDISERQDTLVDVPTELCWRTPVGEGCIAETFNSPAVGLIPTDRAVIAIVPPALIEIVPAPDDPLAPKFEIGPDPVKVIATLTDGSTVEAPVEYADGFGAGYARLPVPPGESVVAAASE